MYSAYTRWKTNPVDHPKLSVVIPVYNEAERVIPTIGAIAAHVSSLDTPWELIIADDGSTDDTVAICQGLGLVNLRVLETARNGGKGSAVRRGVLAARGELILFADADNSTPIEEITHLLDALCIHGHDIAVGSRAVEGANEANKSPLRRIMSDGLRAMVRYGLGVRVRDTQCGFKMFTREAAHELFTRQTIMGFSFDLELLYLARKFGYTVAELPVQWVDAPGSKVNVRKEVTRFLRDMAFIQLNNVRGIYTQQEAPHAHRHRNDLPTGYRLP
jgi:dolichyl-phosphate beta-glucosyltransferase